VTLWREHAKSVQPPLVQLAVSLASILYRPALSKKKGLGKELDGRFAGYGFGYQGKEVCKKGFLISTPIEG